MKAHRNNESGNALWFVLLAVALTAALTAVISRSSDTSEQSGDIERYRVHASEIMRYATSVEQAIKNMQMRGISENNISFENSTVAGYANANCTDSSCKVFDKGGGGLRYKIPNTGWLDSTFSANSGYGEISFFGRACIEGAGCDSDGLSNEDLVMFVPYVRRGLCLQINQLLDIPNPGGDPPVDAGCAGAGSGNIYTGSFAESMALSVPGITDSNKKAGCFQHTGGSCGTTGNSNHFFHVLIDR